MGRRGLEDVRPSQELTVTVVRLRILGESVIEVGAKVIEPDSPRLFALILMLAAAEGQAIPKSELHDLLFSQTSDNRRASHNLRQLLYRLRVLGAPILVNGQRVSVAQCHVETDLLSLLNAEVDRRVTAIARSAVVLPHFSCDAPAAQCWVESYRTRMQNVLRQRLIDDLHLLRQRADWHAVEVVAQRVLDLDPLNEVATLGLAEAIARSGSKVSALALLERYEEEMGTAKPQLALPSQLLRKRIGRLNHIPATHRFERIPLVGRTHEMAHLSIQWDCCHAGCLRSTVVRGEKSIGKSRLLQELKAVVELEGSGTVILAQVSENDKGRPLTLFADIVRKLLALPGAAGCDPDGLPLLRRLTDVTAPNGPIGAAAPHSPYDEARLLHSVADLIASVTEERPLLLIVDDAQDIDAWSLDVLCSIMRWPSSARAFFVLGERTRPGVAARTVRNVSSAITLQPLSQAASRDLLARVSGSLDVALSCEDVEWSIEVAAGNPGHLELLIENCSSSRHNRSVPADLVALTDERLASLSPEATHALEAIALGESHLSAADVAHLTGLGPYSLLSALDELDRRSLIRQSDRGLHCRSGLVAERAMATASTVVTALMHARAAEMLERQHGTTTMTPAVAWRIADHWRAAGEPKRARQRLRACWQQAVDIGRPMVACEGVRRELEDSATPEDRAALLDDLIGALQAAGEHTQAHSVIQQRRALSDQVGDSPARRLALSFDFTETEACAPAKRIQAFLVHAAAPELDAQRRLRSARLAMIAADSLLDQDLASRTVILSGQVVTEDDSSSLLQRQVGLIYHTVFGDRDSALLLAAEIDELIATRERSWSRFVSHRMCSLARYLVGQDPVNYDDLERDYTECLEGSMLINAFHGAAHIASLLIDDGDAARATEWIRKAQKLVRSVGSGKEMVTYLSAQVDLALLAGNEARARQFVAQMQNMPETYESGRLRNDLLLYRLRVEQVCGSEPPDEVELAELLRYHEEGKRFGRHDDHMDVLWVALCSLGRSDEASKLLGDYLRYHRRERRGCRFFLHNRTKSDPAWLMVTPLRAGGEPTAVSER